MMKRIAAGAAAAAGPRPCLPGRPVLRPEPDAVHRLQVQDHRNPAFRRLLLRPGPRRRPRRRPDGRALVHSPLQRAGARLPREEADHPLRQPLRFPADQRAGGAAQRGDRRCHRLLPPPHGAAADRQLRGAGARHAARNDAPVPVRHLEQRDAGGGAPVPDPAQSPALVRRRHGGVPLDRPGRPQHGDVAAGRGAGRHAAHHQPAGARPAGLSLPLRPRDPGLHRRALGRRVDRDDHALHDGGRRRAGRGVPALDRHLARPAVGRVAGLRQQEIPARDRQPAEGAELLDPAADREDRRGRLPPGTGHVPRRLAAGVLQRAELDFVRPLPGRRRHGQGQEAAAQVHLLRGIRDLPVHQLLRDLVARRDQDRPGGQAGTTRPDPDRGCEAQQGRQGDQAPARCHHFPVLQPGREPHRLHRLRRGHFRPLHRQHRRLGPAAPDRRQVRRSGAGLVAGREDDRLHHRPGSGHRFQHPPIRQHAGGAVPPG